MTSVTPTPSNVFQCLKSFLAGIVSPQTSILQAAQNRASEPKGDFIVMTAMGMKRLATNIDDWADVLFTGSLSGTVLTVTGVNYGTIGLSANLFGVGIATNTTIQSQLSGTPGGIGTYQVSISQTVALEAMAAGQIQATQKTEFVVQLDIHGPNAQSNASIVSTLFRDNYAVEQFDTLAASFGTIEPLFTEDPRYLPFVNEEQQYEWRWVVELHLQVDQVIGFPQQFADSLTIGLIEVDATYPP